MGTKKVLVVDFDQESLRFLSRLLRDEGFEVMTAVDGYAGMDRYKTDRPDLVITEAMLPKLHGFELCERIVKSAVVHSPVIIVTGVYRDAAYKTEALHTFGASAYFEKPLDMDEFLSSVRTLLGLPVEAEAKDNILDGEILETLRSGSADPSNGNRRPAAPGKTAKRKELAADDIDTMLQTTLAEFGLNPRASKPKPVRPAVSKPPEKTPPVRPIEAAPVIKTPPAVPDELKAASLRPSPDAKPEEPVAASTPPTPFAEFIEPKKRTFSAGAFGAVVGVMILASALVFVLKPGAKRTPAAPDAAEEVLTTAPETLPAEAVAPDAENPEAEAPAAKPKPAAKEQKAPPTPRVEDIKPALPESTPGLEINVQEDPKALGETAPGEKLAPAVLPDSEPTAAIPADRGEAVPEAIQPEKAKTGDLIPLTEADVQPKIIESPEPDYPPAARMMGTGGSVIVNALISETGTVLRTTVIRRSGSNQGFENAAEAAVRKWKFEPAWKDGVRVRVWKPVSIVFKLK
ncbi:MAG: TonB family protein [Candidatus Aminicenantales bacterium]